jgi:hypothetical protein
MYKILRGNARKAGAVFAEMDANFITVLNALLKLADPSLTLIDYADGVEPAAPETGDSYLVLQAGTVWELTVEVHQIISWDGAAWEVQSFKLSELNAAFQTAFFKAENMAITPVSGITATDVQGAIEELAAAIFV